PGTSGNPLVTLVPALAPCPSHAGPRRRPRLNFVHSVNSVEGGPLSARGAGRPGRAPPACFLDRPSPAGAKGLNTRTGPAETTPRCAPPEPPPPPPPPGVRAPPPPGAAAPPPLIPKRPPPATEFTEFTKCASSRSTANARRAPARTGLVPVTPKAAWSDQPAQ